MNSADWIVLDKDLKIYDREPEVNVEISRHVGDNVIHHFDVSLEVREHTQDLHEVKIYIAGEFHSGSRLGCSKALDTYFDRSHLPANWAVTVIDLFDSGSLEYTLEKILRVFIAETSTVFVEIFRNDPNYRNEEAVRVSVVPKDDGRGYRGACTFPINKFDQFVVQDQDET